MKKKLSNKAKAFLGKLKAQDGMQMPYIDASNMNVDNFAWDIGDIQPSLQAAQAAQPVVSLGNTMQGLQPSQPVSTQQPSTLDSALGALGPVGNLATGAVSLIKARKQKKEAKLMDKMFKEDNERRMENARSSGYLSTPYTVGRTSDLTMREGGNVTLDPLLWAPYPKNLGFEGNLQRGGMIPYQPYFKQKGGKIERYNPYHMQEGGIPMDTIWGQPANEFLTPRSLPVVDTTGQKYFSKRKRTFSDGDREKEIILPAGFVDQTDLQLKDLNPVGGTLSGKSKSKERFREMQEGGWFDSAQQYLNEGMNTATNFFKDVKQEGNKIYDSTSTIERDPLDPYGWQKFGKQVYDSSGKVMNYFPETKQAVIAKGTTLLRPFMQEGGQIDPIAQFMEMYQNQEQGKNMVNQTISNSYQQQSQQLNDQWKQSKKQGWSNLIQGGVGVAKMIATGGLPIPGMQEGGEIDTESLYSQDFNPSWIKQESAIDTDEDFKSVMMDWITEEDGPTRDYSDLEAYGSTEGIAEAAKHTAGYSAPVSGAHGFLPEGPETAALIEVMRRGNSKPSRDFLGSFNTPPTTGKFENKPSEFDNVIDAIAYNESRGRYDVVNEKTMTVGKYQFMEKYWADKIRDYMGLPASMSKREVMMKFKDTPDAQEGFMQRTVEKEYRPEIKKLKPYADKYGLTDDDLIRLMHYRGIADTRKRLQTGNFEVSQSERDTYKNPTIEEYLGKQIKQ